MTKKYKYYTNGIKTIKLTADDLIPEGYYLGRTFKSNPWNKGLTKDDPRVANNLKNSIKTQFKKGEPAWNSGLTKQDDNRILETAYKISKSSFDKCKKSSTEIFPDVEIVATTFTDLNNE